MVLFLSALLSALLTLHSARGATFNVAVNATGSHSIPSTLWGLMFEDISQSGDGGLYGELLQNRAFQQITPGTPAALNAWAGLDDGTSISVVQSGSPLSSALPNALQLFIPTEATGNIGFGNMGYWGIKVDSSWNYSASFYFRFVNPPDTAVTGEFQVGLQSADGTTFAISSAPFTTTSSWTQVSVELTPTASASNTQNNFTVSINDASLVAGQTIEFAMFSLFPPTFKGRQNGMRADLAQTLADMKPGFFRFPGGNNLEGQTSAQRWQWNATVGSLLDRPGRLGDWGYVNTDGLGLLEYMQWIEDVGMEPIMAVWSGYSLNDQAISEPNLRPYIQQAIDQINFVAGDPATSSAAALRASLGRQEPFPLKYIEVGNEEFIAHSSGTFASYRWRDFVGNLSAVFPNLTYIATSKTTGPTLTPKPQAWDIHVYQTPSWFATNSFTYDSFARDGTIYFEGEYAAISTNNSNIFGTVDQGRMTWPTVSGSMGEAAFMTGMERNADIVFAASYAPLLNNVANSQWTPNLVSFNADTVVPSTSYHVQKLFSLFKGDTYLPSTLPSTTGPVFWSVVKETKENEIFIKVVNTAAANNTIIFALPFTHINATGTGTLLVGEATASNTIDAPNMVEPSTFSFVPSANLTYVAPAHSFTILQIQAH